LPGSYNGGVAPRTKRRSRTLAVAVAAAVSAVSAGCVAHEHRIGLGPTGLGETSVRQFYFFFGLVTFNEVNVQRIASDLTSYTIESEFSWTDLLLAPILLPFTVTSRTVTVKT
jgi:hypothetical protein